MERGARLGRPRPAGAARGPPPVPTGAITQVVTATVALRLVAEGLGSSSTLRPTITCAQSGWPTRRSPSANCSAIRAGVDDPVNQNPFGATVTSLVSLAGPVMACAGPRGTVRYSNAGYAVLGQLVTDVTGSRYEEVAESVVLRPLGLAGSFFPARWPEQDVVTGYRLDGAGRFQPATAQICVIPAMGGLWSTAADLSRFGATWTSLLPAGLAAEALRPQPAQQHPRSALRPWLAAASGRKRGRARRRRRFGHGRGVAHRAGRRPRRRHDDQPAHPRCRRGNQRPPAEPDARGLSRRHGVDRHPFR